MRAAALVARARLLSLVVVIALVAGPLAPPLRASWVISGIVDCGRASGAHCSIGPTITLITDDLGKANQKVTIDTPDWLVKQLGGVDQDDLVAIEVENGPGGA